jgi:hypothetical protein
MRKLSIDRRFRFVKDTEKAAYAQMVRYFAARYSWGQPCDPLRARDWAALAGYLATCQCKGEDPIWHDRFVFPSGNIGSPSGLTASYHDGWELLSDLGVHDAFGDYQEAA